MQTRALARKTVLTIAQRATLERQTAAAYAGIELIAQLGQRGNALIELRPLRTTWLDSSSARPWGTGAKKSTWLQRAITTSCPAWRLAVTKAALLISARAWPANSVP